MPPLDGLLYIGGMRFLALRVLGLPVLCLAGFALVACQASGTAERHGWPGHAGPIVFDAHTLVIGNHAGSVSQVMNDLRAMGFALVDRDRGAQIPDNAGTDVKPATPPENELLRRGFLAGAEMLVIVRVDGPRQIPAVRVTGVDVENGTVLWMGGVVSSRPVAESEYHRRLMEFASQALKDGMTNPAGESSTRFSHH